MKLCNYIETVNINPNPIKFNASDYRDNFVSISNKYGHTNYPIVDQDNTCIGMLRLIDQNNYEKYNVIARSVLFLDHVCTGEKTDWLCV